METKKTVKVELQVRELVFDIMNKTHLTGVSRIAEGTSNFEAGAHMQASEDAEHSYQIRRSISNAFSHLKTELGEYLKEDGSSTNNRIKTEVDTDQVLSLTFELPSNFNNSACDSLGGGLHEYIVDRAIYDWFSITNKVDADAYMSMAVAALESTKKALYKRERPTRPLYVNTDLTVGDKDTILDEGGEVQKDEESEGEGEGEGS